MPTEIRKLIFSRDELAEAIANHRNGHDNGSKHGDLPSGAIMFCRVHQDTQLRVTVKVLPDGETNIRTVQLEPEFVGAALMQYCIERKIPMPKGASKSLEAMGENIAMNLSIEAKVSQMPNVL